MASPEIGSLRFAGRPYRRRTLPLIALLLLGASAAAVEAQNTSIGACLDALTGRDNNCTANDVRVGLVNVSSINDGCVSFSDTTTLTATARIESGPQRYDVGVFVALDSASAKTGATCLHGYLYPPLVPLGSHDPTSGVGPYAAIDADSCGDVDANEVTLLDLPAITIPCSDADLNGFLELATCSSWDNGADDGNCNSLADALPSTKSKCNCELSTTNVDIPNIVLTKSCAPSVIEPGDTATCTVTYDNNGAGFGDFISFVDDYSETQATLSNLSGPPGDTVTDDGSTITWTPGGAPAAADNVAPGQTASITYDLTIDPGPPTGPVCNTATAFWQGISQPLSVEFCFDFAPTPAIVASVAAVPTAEGVEVRWRTASEAAVLGFELYRDAGAGTPPQKVSEHLLPGALDGRGRQHRVWDRSAPAGRLVYRIRELGLDGKSRWYGPFAVLPSVPSDVRPPAAETAATGPPRRAPAIAAATKRRPRPRPGPRAAADRIKVRVTETGPHLVTVAELAAGLGESPAAIARRLARGRLRLTQRGEEIPWSADGGGAGLVFYGRRNESRYSSENVYWLEPKPGRRMQRVGAFPRGLPRIGPATFPEQLHLERDAFATLFTTTDPESDYWYWAAVFTGVPGEERAVLDLEVFGVAPGAADTELTLEVRGLEPESTWHGGELILNGASLGPVFWDAAGTARIDTTAPASLWQQGANRLEIVGRAGSFLVDSVLLRYERLMAAVDDRLVFAAAAGAEVTVGGFSSPDVSVLDVTDPDRPRRLVGVRVTRAATAGYRATFRAPSSRAAPDGLFSAYAAGARRAAAAVDPDPPSDVAGREAESLIIAPSHLVGAAAPLAAIHRARGLAVEVVDLENVHDEFNHGIAHPQALRRFLSHAGREWARRPRFVLLVGKGTYDYRDLLGHGDNLLPVLMRADPTGLGLAASDAAFGDLDGDGAPELAVGRLPVVDAAELAAYLGKRAAYLGWRGGGGWNRGLILADNPDGSGDFHRDASALAGILEGGWIVDSALLASGAGEPEVETLRQRVIDELGRGRRLAVFLGHGGALQLTAEGVFRAEDVAALDNAGKPTVFLGLTCNAGAFQHPGLRPLAEALVVAADGGAVAAWSGSGLSQNAGAVELGRALLAAWRSGRHAVLGEILTAGIADFLAAGGDPALAAVFNLLGDPTTELD